MARTLRVRHADPAGAHGPQKRVPANRFKLTTEERAALPDPNWVTEDDADFIVGMRRKRDSGNNISLEEVLRERCR